MLCVFSVKTVSLFRKSARFLLVTPRESCMTFTPHITSSVGYMKLERPDCATFWASACRRAVPLRCMGTFSFLAHYSLRSLCVLVAFSAFYRVFLFLVICNTAPRPPPPLEIRTKR